MNFSNIFIERPIATSLLMAGILMAGIVCYPLLPVAALPQVEFPTISVSATLPGASPETMASSVATPLERQFSQISGVTQMTSTSALGVTSITVQFALDRNIDAAAQDIQSAINAAGGQLPKTLPSPPTYRKVNPSDAPILIMSVQSNKFPLTTVDDYADTHVAQALSQIDGIAQVIITGEQKPAVRVQLDPAKLAALGLSLEDVRTALTDATVDAPKGSIDGPTQSFAIYSNDQLLKAKPWNDVIIAYRNGAPVRIRDVGRAISGPENNKIASWQNGKPGIQLLVFKQPGANVIDAVDRVKAALPKIEAAIPAGINISILTDRTQTIRASVSDIQFTMLLTIALVVAVIFLFLRTASSTIISSLAVPMSLVATLGLMYLAGFSLDNLSLMGLTIAVGFVVDDAIVMLENIYRHIELGMAPMQAARQGASEIGFTIISMSISLVAVFIPVLLMGGIVGRLFREFALVVTMTIMMSAFVSLTLTPMMSARFLHREHKNEHGRFFAVTERYFDKMRAAYERGLHWVMQHQPLTMLIFAFTVVATVALYIVIPKGFFPQQDTGFVFGFSQANQDISFAAMVERQKALARIVAKDRDVESYSASVGATGGSQTVNVGRFWINLKPKGERTDTINQVIARIRRETSHVPGITLYLQAQQDVNVGGRLSRTQYQYTLSDPELSELDTWAPKIYAELKKIPQLSDVATDQQFSAPALTVNVDRDTASRFGILPQVIDDTLYDAFGQRQVTQYFTDLSQYHVVMEIEPQLQADPQSLDKIYVKSPTSGGEVPLSTFVKWDTDKNSYLSVNHQGSFPAATISFNLAPGVSLGEAVTAIQATMARIQKPASLVGSFQGTAQAFQSSLASEPYLLAAAVVVIYIVLGMLYESYIHPLTILSTLPSAGLGALLMLYIFGYDLSVIALIGIILLIGIVKKNAIMMVDFALVAQRDENKSPEEAIFQAALVRFRPIMMTTMAALLGGVPLMLAGGAGAELRRPLGFAIVGGLLLSQVLTLFTTPVIYLYMNRLPEALQRVRQWVLEDIRELAGRLRPRAAQPDKSRA